MATRTTRNGVERWTPAAVIKLLHCFCLAYVEVNSEHDVEMIYNFSKLGLVTIGVDSLDTDSRYDCIDITDKGRVLIEMILHTPMPEQRFVDPRTGGVVHVE